MGLKHSSRNSLNTARGTSTVFRNHVKNDSWKQTFSASSVKVYNINICKCFQVAHIKLLPRDMLRQEQVTQDRVYVYVYVYER
jgi:hypothetical protein